MTNENSKYSFSDAVYECHKICAVAMSTRALLCEHEDSDSSDEIVMSRFNLEMVVEKIKALADNIDQLGLNIAQSNK